MNRAKIPELKKNHRTLSEYRAVSRRRGFMEGAKVKYSKIYHGNAKGKDVFRTGVITKWYPNFFMVEWEAGYKECFNYSSVLEKEVKVIRRRKE